MSALLFDFNKSIQKIDSVMQRINRYHHTYAKLIDELFHDTHRTMNDLIIKTSLYISLSLGNTKTNGIHPHQFLAAGIREILNEKAPFKISSLKYINSIIDECDHTLLKARLNTQINEYEDYNYLYKNLQGIKLKLERMQFVLNFTGNYLDKLSNIKSLSLQEKNKLHQVMNKFNHFKDDAHSAINHLHQDLNECEKIMTTHDNNGLFIKIAKQSINNIIRNDLNDLIDENQTLLLALSHCNEALEDDISFYSQLMKNNIKDEASIMLIRKFIQLLQLRIHSLASANALLSSKWKYIAYLSGKRADLCKREMEIYKKSCQIYNDMLDNLSKTYETEFIKYPSVSIALIELKNSLRLLSDIQIRSVHAITQNNEELSTQQFRK